MTIECIKGREHFWYTKKMTGSLKLQECMNCKARRGERFVLECGHEIGHLFEGTKVCRICKVERKRKWKHSYTRKNHDAR